MKDCLWKYKKFVSYYLTEVEPYVASETWLNDTEFFKYYSKYLSEKSINLTKKLSI
jgi:hypothetical protein